MNSRIDLQICSRPISFHFGRIQANNQRFQSPCTSFWDKLAYAKRWQKFQPEGIASGWAQKLWLLWCVCFPVILFNHTYGHRRLSNIVLPWLSKMQLSQHSSIALSPPVWLEIPYPNTCRGFVACVYRDVVPPNSHFSKPRDSYGYQDALGSYLTYVLSAIPKPAWTAFAKDSPWFTGSKPPFRLASGYQNPKVTFQGFRCDGKRNQTPLRNTETPGSRNLLKISFLMGASNMR